MTEELIVKAKEMFEGETPEKWFAFLELTNKSQEIQNRWWQKLQTEVFNRERKFHEDNPKWDWDIKIWNFWDIKWFIKGESENERALIIHFWGDAFRIFCGDGNGSLDVEKVNELLKETKFDIIKNSIDKIYASNAQTIGWEHRNFSFNCIYDGRFPNHQTLSWYAGNKTNDFADQLIAKVRKFQTPEITALFKEINEKCRKP